jgi:hypothetical protein
MSRGGRYDRAGAGDLAQALAARAEDVCRKYLAKGRREGGYWMVGNRAGEAGSSLYVRLLDSPGKTAGKWTDAATGDHGDLLDIITTNCRTASFLETVREAHAFLGATPAPAGDVPRTRKAKAARWAHMAGVVYDRSRPAAGSLVETYLASRGILGAIPPALRFDPRCYQKPGNGMGKPVTWPAMIAAVTDTVDLRVAVHRTWLARDGSGQAPVDKPKKILGPALGHGVWLSRPGGSLFGGEGIETVLSLAMVAPRAGLVAATSAPLLGALILPAGTRRLYIIQDEDEAGERAATKLAERATVAGLWWRIFHPRANDLNDDLRLTGPGDIGERLLAILHRDDRELLGSA